MTARLDRLLERAYHPGETAPGRRCALLLGVLRDQGGPLTSRELCDLTGIPYTLLRSDLALLEAEGRVGVIGHRGSCRLLIPDPPLDLTLHPGGGR